MQGAEREHSCQEEFSEHFSRWKAFEERIFFYYLIPKLHELQNIGQGSENPFYSIEFVIVLEKK